MKTHTQKPVRFLRFVRAYTNYFGGKSPILTHDGKVITPASGFGSSGETYRSVQEAIDHYAYAFRVS